MTQLAVYEHAREALAAAVKFDEVTQLRSAAQKAEAYARIAKDRKLQADAAEIVARAERKLGIMLRAAKDEGLLSKGGRPNNSNLTEPETGTGDEPVFDNTPFTLAEVGIDKKLSSRAQKAAALDDKGFEAAVGQTRDKILSMDAPVVRSPKPKPVQADKPAPVTPLAPRKWHQFSFSVLALCMASDRVGSEAIFKLAEFTGVIERDGDVVEFTPEAIEAMGSLATAALKALDGEQENTPEGSGTAREASGGQPLPDAIGEGDIGGLQHGTQSAPHHFVEAATLREAYEGEIALLAPQIGKLTMKAAEPALRAGRAASVSPLLLAQDLGHPLGTVKTWLNRLGLTNLEHMHEMNAARSAEAEARKAGAA